MALTQKEITDISLAVIQEQGRAVELVGVASSEGGSERVELLITVKGCHDEPCALLLNLTRAGRTELEEELTSKLRSALRSHRVAPS
jgi:hypothetical protein